MDLTTSEWDTSRSSEMKTITSTDVNMNGGNYSYTKNIDDYSYTEEMNNVNNMDENMDENMDDYPYTEEIKNIDKYFYDDDNDSEMTLDTISI